MTARAIFLGAALLGFLAVSAHAQDADICFLTAERVDDGESLSEAERAEGYDACMRALAATASVVQKHQFQEAAFAIKGTLDGATRD